jgi:hypothetical protein
VLIYEYVLRRIGVLRVLFGIKTSRAEHGQRAGQLSIGTAIVTSGTEH